MTRKIDSLYICPWSFGDALCQSQSLPYIRHLADNGRRFAFITFESDGVRKPPVLIHENITWHPVVWNSGNALSKKVLGILRVIAKGSWLCLKQRPALVHSRTSLPAFMAVCLKKVFRRQFLYDADSILSDEYADTGHLSSASSGFKFLRWSEKWARYNADAVIVLTDVMRDIYRNELAVTQPIDVIPCCVDRSKFQFSDEARERKRDELGVAESPLLVYVGKAGSWYLVDETFAFFKAFRAQRPGARLLIVSTDPAEVFHEIAAKQGIRTDLYFVRKAAYEEVAQWLSASDAGLALIKQLPSKRGSSPVKLAEYLSCGLPVVITDGIGDCTQVVKEQAVGVVLPTTDDASITARSVDELLRLLQNGEVARNRCQDAARQEFDLYEVGCARYRQVYGRLLGATT